MTDRPVDTSRVTREAVAAMAERIRPHIRRTPMLSVDLAEFDLPSAPAALKLELLQHTGSFKARGAFANLLTRAIPEAGVAAASGGNHGAAVAYAARSLGIRASIFVPSVASPAKLALIRRHGAELNVVGDRYDEALTAMQRFQTETGALGVHAYEQVETLLGQGTIGLEIEQDAPEVDTLLVAVGGGGLVGGISTYLGGRVKIVAVEPETAPTLNHALKAGEPVDAPAGGVAADSLAPKRIGSIAFAVVQTKGVTSVLVEDDAIRSAQRLIWERLRLVAEPGGATAFAALLSQRYVPAPGERVGVLLCGANTDAVRFD